MAGFLDDNTQKLPHGTIDEIFNIPIGALILIDHSEHDQQKASFLAKGTFSINLVIRAAFGILASVCSIGNFQWPITKDTVIIRITVRSFVIAMPNLLYGLQFPKLIDDIYIENLVTIFSKFSDYLDLNQNHQGYPLEDNTPNIWNIIRPTVEPMANEALTRLGQRTGKSLFNTANRNTSHQRAIHMSFVTKFIVDSMVRTGTLTQEHLSTFGSETPNEEQVVGVLYPSVNIFTCLVDSMELLSLVMSSGDLEDIMDMLGGADIPLHGSRDDIGYCLWCVNGNGLVALLSVLNPVTPISQGSIRSVVNENEKVDNGNDEGKVKEKEDEDSATSAINNNNINMDVNGEARD